MQSIRFAAQPFRQAWRLDAHELRAILGIDSRDRSKDWNDHIAITSGIYPDENTHIEVVRYNKGSDLMYGLATVLTDGGGKVPRVLRFFGNILRTRCSSCADCGSPDRVCALP